GLATALVVRALAGTHAAEVEAERGGTCLLECARDGRHHLVVHRAAEEGMRMRDDGDGHRSGWHCRSDLDRARRAVQQRAACGRRHQILSRSTTRPCTRCSSMISSMSDLSTYV